MSYSLVWNGTIVEDAIDLDDNVREPWRFVPLVRRPYTARIEWVLLSPAALLRRGHGLLFTCKEG